MTGDYIRKGDKFYIPLSEATFERLRGYRKKGESFDDAVKWIMDYAEKDGHPWI
jgi:hypothetical protein